MKSILPLPVAALLAIFLAPARACAQAAYDAPYTFTILAGSAVASGAVDATGESARFFTPCGVAVDGSGNVYVADTENNVIRKITPEGVVTTLAGKAGSQGAVDGVGAAARFSGPYGVAADAKGNVYVADAYNNTIRKISGNGVVTTLAGSPGVEGTADGTGSTARFASPMGVAVDNVGNVYVADTYNATIRKITSAGVVTTIAGTARANGIGHPDRFAEPVGIAADNSGNVYVADVFKATIMRITSGGIMVPFAGVAETRGLVDGSLDRALFQSPGGLAVDESGNVYVADTGNHVIRRITPAGVVSTLAGKPGPPVSANGTGSNAGFLAPSGVAVTGAGILYVADGNIFEYFVSTAVGNVIRRGTAGAVAVPTTPDMPVIVRQPASHVIATGSAAVFTVAIAGELKPSFQWFRDGAPLNGSTESTLIINSAGSVDAGKYSVLVTNAAGSVASDAATLSVASGTAGRISNVSVRTTLAAGQNLIVGVVTTGAKELLVRAVGPTLKTLFNLASASPDPVVTLFDATQTAVAENDDWTASLSSTFQQLGAFPLASGSKDAALKRTVSGAVTAHVRSSGPGVLLLEVYDADAAAAGRLVNFSSRNQVGVGADVLIAGFVIDGAVSRTVLIRGAGPALYDSLAIPGALPNPKLKIFDRTGSAIGENDDWTASLLPVFTQVGASSFTAGSKDAALVVTLAPGPYTAVVSGVGGSTGDGIIEVYELP